MSTYASYPPRHQYGHPPPPYGGWQPGMRGDPMSSPPSEGFHPPYHRYPPRPNAAAVTPEQAHMVPPVEFMSPPSNVKKRPFASTSSLSPSKRVRTGKKTPDHGRVGGSLGCNVCSSLGQLIGSSHIRVCYSISTANLLSTEFWPPVEISDSCGEVSYYATLARRPGQWNSLTMAGEVFSRQFREVWVFALRAVHWHSTVLLTLSNSFDYWPTATKERSMR